ncbi:MAG TPA: DUF6265 family protein [Planctomycetota bacterium]|nr:DUF6265 family protein [Planctomycetota bacterium]
MRPRSLAVFALALSGGCYSNTWTWYNVPSVQSYAWIEGTWDGKIDDAEVEQYWSRPAGGTILGHYREVKPGTTVASTFLRFEQRADGMFLVALPQGEAAQEYKLASNSPSELIFERATPPARLLYLRDVDGSLMVRFESEADGKPTARSAKLTKRD